MDIKLTRLHSQLSFVARACARSFCERFNQVDPDLDLHVVYLERRGDHKPAASFFLIILLFKSSGRMLCTDDLFSPE